MGVLNRGILGGFRGSVGPVTGTSWKGIDVMKSKPLSVANPRTPSQTAQRSKFSGAVALATALLANIVKPLWDRFAQRQSGYNAFVSTNISNFNSTGEIIDYADVIASQGTLAPLESFAPAEGGAPETVDFTFGGNGGFADDEIYITVINETTGDVEGFANAGVRSQVASAVTLSNIPSSNDVIHVYASMKKSDGTLVSNTEYGTYTIA